MVAYVKKANKKCTCASESKAFGEYVMNTDGGSIDNRIIGNHRMVILRERGVNTIFSLVSFLISSDIDF